MFISVDRGITEENSEAFCMELMDVMDFETEPAFDVSTMLPVLDIISLKKEFFRSHHNNINIS